MEKLVKFAKKGHMESFSKLITEIQVELYNIAKMKLSNEDDVNDVIQETIIDIHGGLRKLKENKLFKTWAIRILINNCNSMLKKRYKNKNVISFDLYIDKNKEINNSEYLEKVNSKISFEQIINCLSEREQNVFILYYSENYTISEISDILQMSSNTVKSILKRGKEKLKNNFVEVNTNE